VRQKRRNWQLSITTRQHKCRHKIRGLLGVVQSATRLDRQTLERWADTGDGNRITDADRCGARTHECIVQGSGVFGGRSRAAAGDATVRVGYSPGECGVHPTRATDAVLVSRTLEGRDVRSARSVQKGVSSRAGVNGVATGALARMVKDAITRSGCLDLYASVPRGGRRLRFFGNDSLFALGDKGDGAWAGTRWRVRRRDESTLARSGNLAWSGAGRCLPSAFRTGGRYGASNAP
jgi:hypothetical protein